MKPAPTLGRLCKEIHDRRADQFFGGIAEQLRRPGIYAFQPSVGAGRDVSDRRLLVQVAISQLTFLKTSLCTQALQFGCRTRGENLKDK